LLAHAQGSRDGVERRFWKQQGGRWTEGPLITPNLAAQHFPG
jgi:hypothetical protein